MKFQHVHVISILSNRSFNFVLVSIAISVFFLQRNGKKTGFNCIQVALAVRGFCYELHQFDRKILQIIYFVCIIITKIYVVRDKQPIYILN